MKTSIKFLALLLATLALSGCASTCKKCGDSAIQNSPEANSPVVAVQPPAAPVSEPVAPAKDYIPDAVRK